MKRIKRDFRLDVRVTKDEHETIKCFAKLAGLTNSEYIRRRAFNIHVVAKLDLIILNEIRRQGGLIKHLYNEAQGMYNAEFSEALNALASFAHALERELS